MTNPQPEQRSESASERSATKHFGKPLTESDGVAYQSLIDALTELSAIHAADHAKLEAEVARLKSSRQISRDQLDEASKEIGTLKDENASLRAQLAEKMAELETLQSMVKKSNLVEVDSSVLTTDGCGAPVFRKSGKILRHKGYTAEVEDKTKVMMKLAASARKIHGLETQLADLQAERAKERERLEQSNASLVKNTDQLLRAEQTIASLKRRVEEAQNAPSILLRAWACGDRLVPRSLTTLPFQLMEELAQVFEALPSAPSEEGV